MSTSSSAPATLPPHIFIYGAAKKTTLLRDWGDFGQAYEITNLLSNNPTVETLDEFLKENPNFPLNSRGRSGWTAMAVAINRRALPLIKKLLSLDPTLANGPFHEPYQRTYTCCAAATDLKLLQEFIRHGADINLSDGEGATPLFSASLSKNKETTDFLLLRGAYLYESHREELLSDPSRKSWFSSYYPAQTRFILQALERIKVRKLALENLFLRNDSSLANIEPGVRMKILEFAFPSYSQARKLLAPLELEATPTVTATTDEEKPTQNSPSSFADLLEENKKNQFTRATGSTILYFSSGSE